MRSTIPRLYRFIFQSNSSLLVDHLQMTRLLLCTLHFVFPRALRMCRRPSILTFMSNSLNTCLIFNWVRGMVCVIRLQLSFAITKARHVQRSIMKRSAPAISMHMDQDVHEGPSETDGNNNPKAHTSPAAVPHQVVQSTESQNAPLEQPSSSHEATSHENPRKTHEHYGPTEFIVQIRDKLEDITRILVGTQNSLARVIGLLQGLNTVTDRRNRASTPAQSRAAMVTLVLATTSVHIA
ncbi:hypothetical protein ACGC1H_000165 [Rhizoctonia solani]